MVYGDKQDEDRAKHSANQAVRKMNDRNVLGPGRWFVLSDGPGHPAGPLAVLSVAGEEDVPDFQSTRNWHDMELVTRSILEYWVLLHPEDR